MNPYREDPQPWVGVHHRSVTYLTDTLARSLPEGYIAHIGERVYVETPDTWRIIAPDVTVSRLPSLPVSGGASAGVGVAEPPLKIEVQPFRMRGVFV